MFGFLVEAFWLKIDSTRQLVPEPEPPDSGSRPHV